jgi:glutathione-regulated potassium-efflux system ancillary protein KefG
MGRKVDVDDLIDTQDVARVLGLAHRNTVSEYQARYQDMPRPVIDLGRGRSKLWLRPEVERWRSQQVASGRTRTKRSVSR